MNGVARYPEGRHVVKFGDVVNCVNRTTRDPVADRLSRIVGLDHMDSESLPLRRWDLLEDLSDGTSFTRTFQAGQVLFGKRRAYQRKVSVPEFDGVCSGDILVFEVSGSTMLQEFLPYIVQSDGFFEHALGTSAGSLSPRTKWQELAKYEFALPPVEEQRRIVEVLAAVDQVLTRMNEVPHATTRKALMRLWFSGNRNEAAESTLGDVAKFVNGFPFKPEDLNGRGMPVIRIRQLLDPAEPVDRSDINVPDRCRIGDGDIIFSWSATLAVRIWDRGEAILNQHLFRVNPISGIDPKWLALLLEHSLVDLTGMSHGSTMKHITKATLLPYKVLVPSKEEQLKIALESESLANLEQCLTAEIERLSNLRRGLLQELVEPRS